MSGSWKITIVGGSLNGMDFSFPFDQEVLIGRSSKADVRLSNLETDVSGKHIKLTCQNGVPMAVNLSRRSRATFHQGCEIAPDGGTAVVSVQDVIELDPRKGVRIRFDAVPTDESAPVNDEGAPLTAATRWGEPEPTDEPTAVVVETSVLSSENEDATYATRVSGTIVTNVPRPAPLATPLPDDDETVAFPPGKEEGFSFVCDETAPNDAGEGEENEKTRELETRLGAMDEIMALKAALEQKRRKRRFAVVFGFIVVIAVFAGLWFSSRTSSETDRMSFPLTVEGKPDVATYSIKDAEGQVLLTVDYPRDDNMSVTESSDATGVTVVSAMGRDRDVPFFLQFETVSRPEELELDLISSVEAWMARAEESGQGYVFDRKIKDDLAYRFFEDVFPGSCQIKSLYGIKFVMFDYKRAWADGDMSLWHGVVIYFRCGDTVFVHRREIPDAQWVRGGYRIEQDPNIAIHSAFAESYWESPGKDDQQEARQPAEQLMESVRGILAKEECASDWRYAKKDIDAILVKTWRTDPKTRDLAVGCLRQFREILRRFYWGEYNAFDTARKNCDEKGMATSRRRAAMVFDDPSERYYYLVANGEVW